MVLKRHGKRVRNKLRKRPELSSTLQGNKEESGSGKDGKDLSPGVDQETKVVDKNKEFNKFFEGLGDVVSVEEDWKVSSKYQLDFEDSVNRYCGHLKNLLINEAIKKGYAEGDSFNANGRRSYDFIEDYVGEGHALGEIIYKVMRYKRKKDPNDMLKIGAWGFLVWDKNQRRLKK